MIGACQQDVSSANSSGSGDMPDMDGPLKGSVWAGTGGKWDLTLKITSHMTFEGNHTILGSIRSSRTECFKATDLSVRLTDATIKMFATSHGTMADSTSVDFKGDISGKTMTGRLTVSASSAGSNTGVDDDPSPGVEEICDATNLPFVFERVE